LAFISTQFLIFLLVVTAVHFMLPVRARWIWLLAASLFFYGLAEPIYLIQILAATGVSFWLGKRIEAAPDKKAKQRVMALGVLLLAANLVVFKYTPFLNETLRSLLGMANVEYPVPELQWLLPIGISFYTFQLISYLVDVFRGQQKAEREFGAFALYVTFFPKLVAGPIERAKNLLPQIHAHPAFDRAQAMLGMQLILWGLFKKVFVADRIAPFVNAIYDNPEAANGVQIAFATWLYAFQLYCDFSGYTDIALGIALIFGYRLTQNFNRPYFATSIQDFWKRWHISLTSWLTDYIFTPITRQKTFKIKFFNLMLYGMFITFVVSGLWHGAAWTYVVWGALHGGYIVVSLLLQKRWNNFARAIKLIDRPNLYRALKISVTFSLVCFAYIFFRASSMDDALHMVASLGTGWGAFKDNMLSVVGANRNEFFLALIGITVVMGAEVLQGRINMRQAIDARPAWMRWSLYYVGTLAVVLLGAFYGSQTAFIYFRF
jgi:D-alanyl-lipoteichoic acid acyltransferase DltB (MBOAT superfamily)